MSLTDAQIAAMMQKHITCKTVLINPEEEKEIVQKHTSEGWEIANRVECNGRIKVTFRKVEKIDSKS